ncbi:MAG: hypothetical protein HYU37_01505 [Acidobacteria bacterium]|nr:hypothetical protein [Acidobacteriota bacterium]
MRGWSALVGLALLASIPALARGQSPAARLEGMWSDPPVTPEGLFCFFACTDTGLARLNALLDNPANDARPFQELQTDAKRFEREYLRDLLTPAARTRYPFDPAEDPGFLHCEPWAVARQIFAPHQLEIRQRGAARLELRYGEWDGRRTIYLDGRRPGQAAPSAMGHSVGRWEGDAFVVETSGVAGNIIMLPDLQAMGEHSGELRIVERYTRSTDGGSLRLTATLTDARSFRQPLVLKKIWRWAPEQQIAPYDACERPTEVKRGQVRP